MRNMLNDYSSWHKAMAHMVALCVSAVYATNHLAATNMSSSCCCLANAPQTATC